MNWFTRLFTRNYAVSGSAYEVRPKEPVTTDWSVKRGVSDGYAANVWTYRAIYQISKACSSVPWTVFSNGEPQPQHPISSLLSRPNPAISRQKLFELLSQWLEISGNAYLHKVRTGKNSGTVELWPVSPDRLTPISGATIAEWVSGYSLDDSRRVDFLPEDILHFELTNPADPRTGMSPLKVAGMAVDADIAQQRFNIRTGQNYGVVDGVFTFERPFSTLDEAEALAQKIEEKYGKRRGFVVLGSNAKYQRVAATPVEMDFLQSRKFNQTEILTVFGVPLPLISPDRMTYNNFAVAEQVFWSITVIPLLDDIADTFNFSLAEEIGDNAEIGYDLSKVPAVRAMYKEKAETAKVFFDMGVPVSILNARFGFGIEEYPGWDRSSTGEKPESQERKRRYTLAEYRAVPEEIDNEIAALLEKDWLTEFQDFFRRQQADVFAMIEAGAANEIVNKIAEYRTEFSVLYARLFQAIGARFGAKVVVERRTAEPELSNYLEDYLLTERALLTEKSKIEENTVDTVLAKITAGMNSGATTAQIQQTIIDSGIFSPERALRLARTISGTAASVGQYHGARLAGANEKIWRASMHHSRPEHLARNGETRPMNERFSAKFGMAEGPMYPLDPILVPADRVN